MIKKYSVGRTVYIETIISNLFLLNEASGLTRFFSVGNRYNNITGKGFTAKTK
jgi:hypothetical protein